jgi:hypothetical protein
VTISAIVFNGAILIRVQDIKFLMQFCKRNVSNKSKECATPLAAIAKIYLHKFCINDTFKRPIQPNTFGFLFWHQKEDFFQSYFVSFSRDFPIKRVCKPLSLKSEIFKCPGKYKLKLFDAKGEKEETNFARLHPVGKIQRRNKFLFQSFIIFISLSFRNGLKSLKRKTWSKNFLKLKHDYHRRKFQT